MKSRPVAQILEKFGSTTPAHVSPCVQEEWPEASIPPEVETATTSPEDSVKAALSEARDAGAEEAARFYEGVLKDERRRASSDLAEARERWACDEGERLADALRAGLIRLEECVCESVTTIMLALFKSGARERALDELDAVIRTIVAEGEPNISIRGRTDLLSSLQKRLGGISASVEFIEDTAAEVCVIADRTKIETRFLAWRDSIELAGD